MRRIVRRRDDNAVGQSPFPPAIVGQDRVRNHRGWRIFVSFGDHHLDSVRRQHLEGGGTGRNRQRVRINAEKERAGYLVPRAVEANRLSDREDVPFIESLFECGTTMS